MGAAHGIAGDHPVINLDLGLPGAPPVVKEAAEILDISISKAWFEKPEYAKAACERNAGVPEEKKIKPIDTPYLDCDVSEKTGKLTKLVESWWPFGWGDTYEELEPEESTEDDPKEDQWRDFKPLDKLASVMASGPAANTPAMLAAGIGASVGVMAGLGALLSEDGDGTGGDGEDARYSSAGYPSDYSMSYALSEASDHVSGLMARSGLESSASGYGPPAFSPHTGLPVQNRRGLTSMASGLAFWLRAFSNRARYRSRGGLNPEAGHLGLAAGYDLRLNATRFGVLAGYYGQGEPRFEGPQRFRPGPNLFKDPFAGVYVRRDFAPFSVQVGLSGGTLEHASSHLVNDNLAPNGLAQAEARTRSWWLAPEARVGLRLDAGLMQFEPAFTVRYARQSIQGFSETGVRAPATVGQRKVELLETRLELKASREMGPSRIALRLGWKYRDDLKSNEAQVRMLGESQRVRLESGLGSSFYLGAEAEFELAPGLFLNLSGEAVSGNGYQNMSGMASVYWAF